MCQAWGARGKVVQNSYLGVRVHPNTLLLLSICANARTKSLFPITLKSEQISSYSNSSSQMHLSYQEARKRGLIVSGYVALAHGDTYHLSTMNLWYFKVFLLSQWKYIPFLLLNKMPLIYLPSALLPPHVFPPVRARLPMVTHSCKAFFAAWLFSEQI